MTKNIPCYSQRVRNELRFRELTVLRVEHISAGFQRIVLGGDALDGSTSHGLNDHIKVLLPEPDSNFVPPVVTDEGTAWVDGIRPLSRDYTPLYDETRHELALDLYIHDGDVASTWAINAHEDDKLMIGGPCSSLVVPEDYAYRIYACDESGILALRRRLKSLNRSAVRPHVTVLVSVQDTTYQDYFVHLDGFTLQWLIGHNEQAVNKHLSRLSVPVDDYSIWITGEDKVAKNLYVRSETEVFDQ